MLCTITPLKVRKSCLDHMLPSLKKKNSKGVELIMNSNFAPLYTIRIDRWMIALLDLKLLHGSASMEFRIDTSLNSNFCNLHRR